MATGQQAEPQVDKIMDPVCGFRVDPERAAGRSEYEGHVYYFHSEACKAEFDASPATFAGRGAVPHTATRVDPVCGRLVADVPGAPHATFDGVTYVFSSEECRREFLHKPERFVSSLSFEPGRHAAG